MSVTFSAEGLHGGYVTRPGHECDDYCYSPCKGEWVEAGVNMSNMNAGSLLRVLGLGEGDPSWGECDAADFLARVDLALVVRVDVTRPTVTSLPDAGARTVSFGLSDGDVVRRLERLREVAVQAQSLGARVVWA